MLSIAETLAQAEARRRMGDFHGAETDLRQGLAAEPMNAEVMYLLGDTCHRLGKLGEAEVLLERAILVQPEHAAAHNSLGAVLGASGRFALAEQSFQRAASLKADYLEAIYNLAALAIHQNKVDQAIACWQRIVELQPGLAEAHSNLGALWERRGNVEQAAASYRRALGLKPELAEAHNNLGSILEKQGQLVAAAACCRKALELKPDFVVAHYNLAVALEKQDDWDAAEASFRRALALQPDFSDASKNLAAMLIRQGRINEARDCYLHAHRLQPNQELWRLSIASLCPLVFQNNDQITAYRQQLLAEVDALAAAAPRFDIGSLPTFSCAPPFNLQFHGQNERPLREAFANLFRASFAHEKPARPSGKPRVGFVVTAGHEKLFLKSMGGILARLNPKQFDLFVVASRRAVELFATKLGSQTIQWVSVGGRLEEFVATLRSLMLDLIYHWEIGTDGVNYFLPFFRLAPVQCTSWGIQVTSGIPGVDHYLSSKLVEPDDAQEHYTEKLALSDTLLTYQHRASSALGPANRESLGIANDSHLYLCAQQLGKFHSDFDPILAGILQADARAVIVVTEDRHGSPAKEDLRQRFASHMHDDASRIKFVPFQPTDRYLSLTAAADVVLDPLHFGGVNTTYDAFSLHQPIVTLPSRYQRGRYALGCYKKMGIFDCVAADPRQYVEIAVALANDRDFRRRVVNELRDASPVLFEDQTAVSEHERIFGDLIARARTERL